MKYIHFTDITGAREIIATKRLDKSSYAGNAVYAIAVGGAYVPTVQRSKHGRARGRNIAVIFETDYMPDVAYPEEVMWHMDALPIKNVRTVPAAQASDMLDDSIPRDNDDRLQIPLHPSEKVDGQVTRREKTGYRRAAPRVRELRSYIRAVLTELEETR